jgi:DNA-binding NarL/FixJ family response regulator
MTSELIKILVAGGSEIVRTGLTLVLEQEGDLCVVATLDTTSVLRVGESAIQIKPDVIILNLDVPAQVLKQLVVTIKRHFDAPVIAVMEANEQCEIAALISAGIVGICSPSTKPFEVRHAVRSANLGALWIAPQFAHLFVSSPSVETPDEDGSQRVEIEDLDFSSEQVRLPWNTAPKAAPAPKPNVAGNEVYLSVREKQILRLMVDGKKNAEIAADLGIAVDTVKAHVSHVLQKLGVTARGQAIIKAVKTNLVTIAG